MRGINDNDLITEEPCEVKVSSTVLKTNGVGDNFVEFNEMHQDALLPGSRVLIVDDLIATGGTAAATASLVQQIGCELVGFGFIIELVDLSGRKLLPDIPIRTLFQF